MNSLANDSIDCGMSTGSMHDRFIVVPFSCPLYKNGSCEEKVYLVTGTFYRNPRGCSVSLKTEEQTLIELPTTIGGN